MNSGEIKVEGFRICVIFGRKSDFFPGEDGFAVKIEEHIRFWLDGADHDLDTAESLFIAEKFDWCLFWGHLVLEKALKAMYVRDNNNRMPPRVHSLVRLAEKTSLPLTEERRLFFDEVTDFNLEVRYPEYRNEFRKKCTKTFCDEKFTRIKESYQ